MRKFALTVAALAPAAFLAACAGGSVAPTGDAINASALEMDRMYSDCAARGGTLVPSGRSLTGQPQLDNVCRINPVERRT